MEWIVTGVVVEGSLHHRADLMRDLRRHVRRGERLLLLDGAAHDLGHRPHDDGTASLAVPEGEGSDRNRAKHRKGRAEGNPHPAIVAAATAAADADAGIDAVGVAWGR